MYVTLVPPLTYCFFLHRRRSSLQYVRKVSESTSIPRADSLNKFPAYYSFTLLSLAERLSWYSRLSLSIYPSVSLSLSLSFLPSPPSLSIYCVLCTLEKALVEGGGTIVIVVQFRVNLLPFRTRSRVECMLLTDIHTHTHTHVRVHINTQLMIGLTAALVPVWTVFFDIFCC